MKTIVCNSCECVIILKNLTSHLCPVCNVSIEKQLAELHQKIVASKEATEILDLTDELEKRYDLLSKKNDLAWVALKEAKELLKDGFMKISLATKDDFLNNRSMQLFRWLDKLFLTEPMQARVTPSTLASDIKDAIVNLKVLDILRLGGDRE